MYINWNTQKEMYNEKESMTMNSTAGKPMLKKMYEILLFYTIQDFSSNGWSWIELLTTWTVQLYMD
jgi:hypothetical protein